MATSKPDIFQTISFNSTTVSNTAWRLETMLVPTIGLSLAGVLLLVIIIILCSGYLKDEEDDEDFKELPIIRPRNSTITDPLEVPGLRSASNQEIAESIPLTSMS